MRIWVLGQLCPSRLRSSDSWRAPSAFLRTGPADSCHKRLDASVLSIVMRPALRMRELGERYAMREHTGALTLEGFFGVNDAMRSLCRGAAIPTHSLRASSSVTRTGAVQGSRRDRGDGGIATGKTAAHGPGATVERIGGRAESAGA